MAAAILVVDDSPELRSAVIRTLERAGHYVTACGDVDSALAALDSATYDVVLTDLRMPGGSGLDLLAEVQRRFPATLTMLMSGEAETSDAAAAIDYGVSRLLLKPFEMPELISAVDTALAQLRARALEREELSTALAREREVASRSWIIRAAHALAAAVEAKDAYTAGHAERVTAYALALAEALGETELDRLRLASGLHDVGKIGVPDAVLNKDGPLDDVEFDQIRMHAVYGERILRPLLDDPLVLGVTRWHHERWDGGGYPDQLAGETIPMTARIVAVADSLDAMTSARAYRNPLPWNAAVQEVRRCAGTQFDPVVVNAMDHLLPRLHDLYRAPAARPVPDAAAIF